MSLIQKIIEDLKEAMKARDEVRLSCLRMLKTALKNKQVEKRHELKDEEIQSVISSLIRKGREAADEFRNGDREDLAAKEEKEVEIGTGSGFVISPYGHVLTNYHVISDEDATQSIRGKDVQIYLEVETIEVVFPSTTPGNTGDGSGLRWGRRRSPLAP